MQAKVQLVMFCSKFMNVSEKTVVGCGLIYNQGKWKRKLFREDLKQEYKEYLDGVVSDRTVDFALDFMSGRIPPNLLMNILTQLGKKGGVK